LAGTKFKYLTGICFNQNTRSLFVCDTGDNCIWRVTLEGIPRLKALNGDNLDLKKSKMEIKLKFYRRNRKLQNQKWKNEKTKKRKNEKNEKNEKNQKNEKNHKNQKNYKNEKQKKKN
jgi:hypothetical protein